MNQDDVRRRAYRIYQDKQRRSIPSSEEENWEEAEMEIEEERWQKEKLKKVR